MKRKHKNYISIFVLLLLSFLFIVQAYAGSIDELKKQQDNNNKKMKETKEKINIIDKETKNVSKQIQDLDTRIDIASNDLNIVEDELDHLELHIEETESELHEAEENIIDKQDIFGKRIRVMYKTGTIEYLEVLLSSADIKDFLSRQDMIKSIAKHDKELITYMKEQRDVIDTKKVELETQKNSVEISKAKLEVRKRDLARVCKEKESKMETLVKDKVAYEKEYDKMHDEANALESQIVKLLSNKDYMGGILAWPVPGHTRISSPYGYRIHPVFKVKKLHTGIDIPAPTGTKVIASGSGTVIFSGTLGGYGKAIMIDHGGKIVTLYGHNSALVVNKGDEVRAGDTIAKIGSTGISTGPHCHYEVRKNGAYEDPLPWLKGKKN